jgi:hypothetical protein
MKYLFIAPIALLAACASPPPPQVVTKKVHTVVMPDQSMYYCPTVDKFPEADKLTDIQVARLITQLHSNNITCRNSINSIKRFLEDSKKEYEKGADTESSISRYQRLARR